MHINVQKKSHRKVNACQPMFVLDFNEGLSHSMNCVWSTELHHVFFFSAFHGHKDAVQQHNQYTGDRFLGNHTEDLIISSIKFSFFLQKNLCCRYSLELPE